MDSLSYTKFELDKTQKALQDYKSRFERLQQEHKAVVEDRDKIRQDAEEMIDYLRHTNTTKEATIEKMKLDLSHQRDSLQEDKNVVRSTLEKHIKDLESNLMEYEVQVQTLQAELEIVQDFKNERTALLQELSDNKQKLEEQNTKSKEKVDKLERKYFEEKVRLQKEVATKMAEMKKESEQKAIAHLAQSAKVVFAQNQTLSSSLMVHTKASSSLAKASSQFETEAKDLRRELDLSRGRLKEYAFLTHKQGKEMEALNDKIKTLEAVIATNSQRSRDAKSDNLESELHDSKLDVNALKRLLHLKGIELRKLRMLAQEILDQRSDLEQYFHDSLEYVKNEKTKKSTKQPKTKPDSHTSGKKVRIEDLSWEEREQVLRILFSKINSLQSVSKSQQQPDGSEFDESDEDLEDEESFEGDPSPDEYQSELPLSVTPSPVPSALPVPPTPPPDPETDVVATPHEDTNEMSMYYGLVSSGDFPPLA